MSRPLTRIVIADPHPVLRRGVKTLLGEAERYRVVGEASDTQQTLSLVEAIQPAVALIAHMPPHLDAVALCEMARLIRPGTQIVVHAHQYSETLVAAALDAGAKAFVLQTDPENELIEAIDAARFGRHYFSTGVSKPFLQRILDPRIEAANRCLTLREREVVELIASGCTKRQVAAQTRMSVKTVQTHVTHVMERLNLHNSADLVRFAIRNEVIPA